MYSFSSCGQVAGVETGVTKGRYGFNYWKVSHVLVACSYASAVLFR